MIHRKLSICVIALAAVLLMSSCVSLRVTSDVAVGASAAQCHTFDWAGSFHTDGKPRTVANPLNESRLRTAIAANLASKGVQPASGQADCLVGYGIGVQTVLDGGYPYYGGAGDGDGVGTAGTTALGDGMVRMLTVRGLSPWIFTTRAAGNRCGMRLWIRTSRA